MRSVAKDSVQLSLSRMNVPGGLASDGGQKGRGDISSAFAQVKYMLCCRKHGKVRYVTYSEHTLKIDSH